mmetsp:Transcript_7591/g.11171  ORF Transcript_7591/g.11171 Transcript_7591/m.11171 type:complete len:194 (+) Transcript_7591:2557-3138(+)
MNKVLKDQEMIRQYHMFDKKNIGVQLLEEPDKKLEYSEIIVIVRKWSPSTWELTSPKEIIINKHWRLHEFGENLSKIFEIPHENLGVHRVSYSYNFMRGELKSEKFIKTQGNYHYLSSQPWYLSVDGMLFIIKDNTEELREMTSEEKKKYSAKSFYGFSSVTNFSYESREKSMKITVKKKKKEDPDSQEKEDN